MSVCGCIPDMQIDPDFAAEGEQPTGCAVVIQVSVFFLPRHETCCASIKNLFLNARSCRCASGMQEPWYKYFNIHQTFKHVSNAPPRVLLRHRPPPQTSPGTGRCSRTTKRRTRRAAVPRSVASATLCSTAPAGPRRRTPSTPPSGRAAAPPAPPRPGPRRGP